jgi:GNAT superfamily N-acetyltransferase
MSTVPGELVVARASLDEWYEVEEWAADEQWNPGLGDTPCFHPTDPEGFFVGRLDGRTVSSVSVVTYSERYAFLGYYLVHPDHRGQGLGLATWRAALPHAGTRTVGLDAVPAQEATYRRSGFLPAYRSVRYGGRPVVPAGLRAPGGDGGTVPAARGLLDALAVYDRACFGADRAGFLGRWLTAPGQSGYARLREGRVTGYGVIRPARAGHRIGPLFADTPEDAGELLAALVSSVRPGEEVFLDVPESHGAAVALATACGLVPTSFCVRMYKGPAPATPGERIFAGTSLELG